MSKKEWNLKTYDQFKTNKKRRDLTQEELKKVEWTKYKIIVPTEEDRLELMEAFHHIHNSDIDTDFVAVNQLSHEYNVESGPNNIIVDKELYKKLIDKHGTRIS